MPDPDGKKVSTASGGDRISGLPDDVLHRVLFLLPAREAVRTSVLSRRWRPLWKSNRRLNVTVSLPSEPVSRSERLSRLISQHGVLRGRNRRHCRPWLSLARLLSVAGDTTAVAVDRLNRFVNRLLLLRDPVPLDECKFSFHDFPRVDGAEVDVWIRHVLSWQVRVLHAKLGTNIHTALAHQPLVSVHLKTLELSEVKFRGNILDFSSCTSLVDLKMHACIICVDTIFSPHVRKLTVTSCNFNFDAMTHISVPGLLCLYLANCEGQTPCLENMPLLIRAFMTLGWFDEDRCGKGTDEDHCGEDSDTHCSQDTDEKTVGDHSEDTDGGDANEVCRSLCANCCGICANCCGNGISEGYCVLLDGLSNVTCLRLDPSYQMYTIKRDLRWCPLFWKLKTLILDNWRLNIGYKALLGFLKHTLYLRKLIISVPKDHDPYREDKEFDNQIVECLHLPYLQVVNITYRKVAQRICVWEFMKILEVCSASLRQTNVIGQLD